MKAVASLRLSAFAGRCRCGSDVIYTSRHPIRGELRCPLCASRALEVQSASLALALALIGSQLRAALRRPESVNSRTVARRARAALRTIDDLASRLD